MCDLPPIYRLFPVDQSDVQSHVADGPGIMISASSDEGAASVAKTILHALRRGGELWADNQPIRHFLPPEDDDHDVVLEHVWSKARRSWQSVDLAC